MDWSQLLTEVIMSVLGIVLTFLGAFVMKLINSKIKDDRLRKAFNDAWDIVSNGVDYIYQTYVESLKGTDLWDEAAKKKANEMALDYIKKNLTAEVKDYITTNGKDLEEWIREQIEIAIKQSKEKKHNK